MFSSSRPDFSSYAIAGGNMVSRAVKAALTNEQDYAGIANANKRAEGAVQRQKISSDASLKALEIETDTIKNVDKIRKKAIDDVKDIKKGGKRMAGLLATLGTINTAMYMRQENKERQAREEALEAKRAQRDIKREASAAQKEEALKALIKATKEQTKNIYDSFTSKLGDKKSTDSTDSSDSSATSNNSNVATDSQFGFDFSKLTDNDYDDLAFVVSGEAGPGDDKFAVAASVLNRVKSPDFPNSVKNVIHAPDQYAAITDGLARNRPDIAAELKSPSGIQKMKYIMQKLKGRTDFKGQTLLHNRSNKGNEDIGNELDPMFDKLGNYYHHPWQ